MSDFFHGAKASKQAVSVSTPMTADSSVHLIVGTAPAHMVNGKVNEPVCVSSYEEAVAAMGYSDDWEKYDICEEIYASFKLYSNGPIVIINVLDPQKHRKDESVTEDMQLVGGTLDLPLEVLADTVVVKGYGNGETLTEAYTRGIDYELLYSDGVLKLERIEGGKITSENEKINLQYNEIDPTKVTKADVIGGYDMESKKSSGFELVDSIFPKFGLIPTLFLAPKFSSDNEVATVMATKAENINGLFKGKALIDVNTSEATTYAEAVEWKKTNNITQPSQLIMWPMYTLGGKVYHASVHQAGLMSKTDATEDMGDGTPCESASNKSLKIDGMVLVDGTEVLLDLTKANYLNANGIITALNFIGGFVSWGNETACYPANTDVTDYFYCVSRMFDWVGNSVILSVWNKIDRKLNKRLIESVVDSLNLWLNGLMAEGKILGGRIEFLEEENTETDLMAGKAKFHIYLTPPSPAKELDFVLEYDTSYLENLFAA